jgi:hypothetical protein
LVDDAGRFRLAALRWHALYCGKVQDVGFEEAMLCTPAWPAWRARCRRLRQLLLPSSFIGAA